MKPVKSILLAATAAVLLGAVGACGGPAAQDPADDIVTISASYPHYENLKQLWTKADLVVEATVKPGSRTLIVMPQPVDGQPVGSEEEVGVVYTVRTIVITRVVKGAVSVGQEIEIKELGGNRNGVRYVHAEGAPLADNKRALLFLRTYAASPATLLNPREAQFAIDTAGGYQADPDNKLHPSRADLDALRAGKA